jgi:hypothetical protein
MDLIIVKTLVLRGSHPMRTSSIWGWSRRIYLLTLTLWHHARNDTWEPWHFSGESLPYKNLDVERATDVIVVALKSYKYGIITPVTGVIYHYRPSFNCYNL